MKKNKLIYIVGAGRSGTTALATFLNGSENIICLGELHHLPEYVDDNLHCSCGEVLDQCTFWSALNVKKLGFTSECYLQQQQQLESHKSVLKYLFTNLGRDCDEYNAANAKLLEKVNYHSGNSSDTVCLDSAKYIGRAIALSRNKNIDIRIIYMTRDPRGVALSFAKKVQTSKGTLSASIYYNVINFLAELASCTVLKGKVCKVRYEDLLTNPFDAFTKIEAHIGVNLSETRAKIQNNESFEIGHIVGGNRLKTSGAIKFRNTDGWMKKTSRFKRFAIYILTLPFNLINGYNA